MSLFKKDVTLYPRTAKMCINPFTVITEYNRKVKQHYVCDYAKNCEQYCHVFNIFPQTRNNTITGLWP